MRYFLTKDKLGNVVSKDCLSGGDKDAQIFMASGALEVDQVLFDSTLIPVVAQKDQTDWQNAKNAGTMEALSFIAQKLGFE